MLPFVCVDFQLDVVPGNRVQPQTRVRCRKPWQSSGKGLSEVVRGDGGGAVSYTIVSISEPHRDVLRAEANLREHFLGVHIKVGVAHVQLEEGAAVIVLGVLAATGDADCRLRVTQRQAVF